MGPSTRPPGSEPEDHITVTTVYLDTDYLVDQVFWQHAGLLQDRLDAQELVDTIYTEPAQALRLGEDRTGMLMPWLDELVALSIDGGFGAHFYNHGSSPSRSTRPASRRTSTSSTSSSPRTSWRASTPSTPACAAAPTPTSPATPCSTS